MVYSKLIFVFLAIVQVLKANENAKGVVVIFRHGDRNPELTYKNDPYKGSDHWPEGLGQLTLKGMKQTYELGKSLRTKYGHLLGEVFHKNQIYARSTDIDRTLMSAQSCLAGLFPVKESLRFDPDIAWRPIPVHTVPIMEENLLLSIGPCPKYEKHVSDLMKTQEITDFLRDYEWVRSHVKEHSGDDINDFFYDLTFMYDTLRIEEWHNKTLPAWTKSVYPEKLSDIAHKAFATKTHNREMARLVSGHLAKVVTDKLIAMDSNNITQRLIMCSAHDVTIAYLLSALNLKKGTMPPYAASLNFELVPGQAESMIRVVYEGETLHVSHCGTSCPLSTWKNDYQTLFIDNRDQECSL